MEKVFASDGCCVSLYNFFSAGFLGDRTQTHNHLVRKQTLDGYTKLKFPICLQTYAAFKCCLNY